MLLSKIRQNVEKRFHDCSYSSRRGQVREQPEPCKKSRHPLKGTTCWSETPKQSIPNSTTSFGLR